MKIINTATTAPYPPIQSWNQPTPPEGWAEFPEEFMPIFYPPDKRAAGFVSITEEDGKVTSCVWDEDLYQAWAAENPEQPEPASEPTTDDIINTMLGVIE